MTKTILSILFISAILITGAIAASVSLVEDAEAIKSKGNPLTRVGSAGSVVCGDRLCSAPAPAPAPEPAPVEEAEEAEAEDEMEKEVVLAEEITIEVAETEEETMEMKPHGWITATGTIQSMLDPGLGHETHQVFSHFKKG